MRTKRSTAAQEVLDGVKRRRAGSFAAWRPNVERDAQRRVNIRVTDEIVTALNERRIVMAFEPVVAARSGGDRILRMPGPHGAG